RIRSDRTAQRTLLAVAQLRRDPEPVAAAAWHQLQAFLPARHHLVERELRRLTAFARTVEHLAVQQAALVVHPHPVGGPGAVALARLEHFVLQPAVGDLHLFAPGILGQERGAFLGRPRTLFGAAGLHALTQVLHDLHELLFTHLRL